MLDAPIPSHWNALADSIENSYGTWALRHVFSSHRTVTPFEWISVMSRPLGVTNNVLPEVLATFRDYLLAIGVVGLRMVPASAVDSTCIDGKHQSSPPALLLAESDTRSTRWRFSEPHCVACGKRFTLFHRKHHCRLCEHAFCRAHISVAAPMKYVWAQALLF